jgi:hypothetical protein
MHYIHDFIRLRRVLLLDQTVLDRREELRFGLLEYKDLL